MKNVNLIYRSAESLSYKAILKNIFLKKKENVIHRFQALYDINLTLERGRVYGIIGKNGSGKSTLLRLISGVMGPSSGTMERNHTTISLLALGVGFAYDLSGMDNIMLNGMVLGFSKKQIETVRDEIIEYSELGDFINRPVNTYSTGMVSRLGFSIALFLRPEVLLIDEVMSVGDGQFREKSFQSIRDIIKDKEITVAIVTHASNQILELCNYVYWLDKGRLVLQGEPGMVMATYNACIMDKQFSVDEVVAGKRVYPEDNEHVAEKDRIFIE